MESQCQEIWGRYKQRLLRWWGGAASCRGLGLTVCLDMSPLPLISLEKYAFETGGGRHHHRLVEKIKCGRHTGFRTETMGLSVGSNRIDMRKIPGMLRKHSFPGSQRKEEGHRVFRDPRGLYSISHTHGNMTKPPHISKSISD